MVGARCGLMFFGVVENDDGPHASTSLHLPDLPITGR